MSKVKNNLKMCMVSKNLPSFRPSSGVYLHSTNIRSKARAETAGAGETHGIPESKAALGSSSTEHQSGQEQMTRVPGREKSMNPMFKHSEWRSSLLEKDNRMNWTGM